jgi:hypothetical protein
MPQLHCSELASLTYVRPLEPLNRDFLCVSSGLLSVDEVLVLLTIFTGKG